MVSKISTKPCSVGRTDSQLPCVPPPLPDEWILSYIHRVHLLTCSSSISDSYQRLLGGIKSLSHGLPDGLMTFSRLISSDPERQFSILLRDFTPFPFLNAYTFNSDSHHLRSTVIGGERDTSNATLSPRNRLGLADREPRFCKDCVAEDKKTTDLPTIDGYIRLLTLWFVSNMNAFCKLLVASAALYLGLDATFIILQDCAESAIATWNIKSNLVSSQ